MSDLVERLRLGFARGEISVWKILPEAADEIERLRNQLGKETLENIEILESEVRRLRNENSQLAALVWKMQEGINEVRRAFWTGVDVTPENINPAVLSLITSFPSKNCATLPDDQRPDIRTSFVLDGSCPTCAALARGELCPPHDASPRCESGKRNHCSCDICF